MSATKWLAPLAVLVPLLATLIGVAWARTISPPLLIPTAVGGLALTAAAGRRQYGNRVPLLAATWTLLATPVAPVPLDCRHSQHVDLRQEHRRDTATK